VEKIFYAELMMTNLNLLMQTLSQYQPILLAETNPCAAVMVILLVDGQNGTDTKIEIILTKRAASLPTYAGDYSLPGGIKDTSDLDLYATAVRELNEELAIPLGTYKLIGQLDDFEDRFGKVVRPFIAIMEKNNFEKLHKISTDEIASIYYFPLHELKDLEDMPELHTITRRRPSYAFRKENFFVWGLTAGILVHLWNIIGDEKKEVGKKIIK
jgi:8-oxo-dGTP pyrophosphatase MutT (NUDIX family)